MKRPLAAFLFALPCALAVEGFAAIHLMTVSHPLTLDEIGALIGMHLFASVLMAEGLRLRYKKNSAQAKAAWQMALTLSLLIPGYGVLLSAVMILRPVRSANFLATAYISPMDFRQKQAEAELAKEAEKGTAGVHIEAISDALKDQDKAKRLGAVEALRALENKQAVELLSKSLNNTVFEVRYHAVEALSGINKKFSKQIYDAMQAIERQGTPENYQRLGNIYYEYAILEMEDPSIQIHLYRNVVEYLRRAIELSEKTTPETMLKIAHSLEALGETDETWQTYKAVVDRYPNHLQALLGMARLQYKLGRYDQLRSTCRRILEIDPKGVDQENLNVLALWAEGPEGLGMKKNRLTQPLAWAKPETNN